MPAGGARLAWLLCGGLLAAGCGGRTAESPKPAALSPIQIVEEHPIDSPGRSAVEAGEPAPPSKEVPAAEQSP